MRTVSWEATPARSTVVLVHGLGDHSGRYWELGETLADRGHSLVSYDQRGHGQSGGRRGDTRSFGLFLSDLDLVLNRLVEARGPGSAGAADPPLFLIGHSMGGLVTLRYLDEYGPRPRGAILSAPWLGTASPVPPWKRRLGRLLGAVAPGFAISTGTDPSVLTRDPERLSAWTADRLVHSLVSPRLFEEVEAAQRSALRGSPGVETLFLVPGDDRLVDSRVTLSYVQRLSEEDTTVIELPGFRHEPWNDLGRVEVFRDIGRWLEARIPITA